VSKLTSYASLKKHWIPLLPGCDDGIVLNTLKRVGRKFCEDTEAWKEEFHEPLVNYQQDYQINYGYSAEIQRIDSLRVNAVKYHSSYYGLYEGDTIRFKASQIPNQLDDMLLTCDTAGTTTIADWNAITDGSFTVGIDTGTYSVEELDFSNAVDMDGVAQVMMTGLRQEREANQGFIRYDSVGTRFMLYVDSGTITVLTAGASGTDISGSGYMNGLTGAGEVSGHMMVDIAFLPDSDADDLADYVMDRWGLTILGGAVAELAAQPKKPWTDPSVAADQKRVYKRGWVRAKAENDLQNKQALSAFMWDG